MKEKFDYDYTSGDFKKQYYIFKSYGYDVTKVRLGMILQKAATQGELPIVIFALNNGPNVHYNDDTALKFASEAGHYEIVKYLVEHGANIHAENDLSVKEAIKNGNLEIVKHLVENGAVIDDKAIKLSIKYGKHDITQYLMQK